MTGDMAAIDPAEFGFILDARAPAAFAAGHLPGAVNLPDLSDTQRATLVQWQGEPAVARRKRVAMALLNIADAIGRDIAAIPKSTRILVVAGDDALAGKLWSDALQTIGFRVDVATAAAPVEESRRAGPPPTAVDYLAAIGRYALVVDARSEREYAEDHVPGAVNLPVAVNDEYAEVGTVHRTDPHQAYLIGVAYSLRNISRMIGEVIAPLPPQSRVLVYCFRGGKRSRLWFDAFSSLGYPVDRIPGGWKAYRNWVRAELATLPERFRYEVLCGPTGCGKTRLLGALAELGEQVIDLEAIACHRGSLIGAVPGVDQPSQKYFDTLVLDCLQRMDPARPVWVESESKKIGRLRLPEALYEAMHGGRPHYIEAEMAARVKMWREDYGHFERNPQDLIGRLHNLRPIVGGDEFDYWEQLGAEGQVLKLFERLMVAHYDPTYERSLRRNYPESLNVARVELPSLEHADLLAVARTLVQNAA